MYTDSPLSFDEVLETGVNHVAIATGSTWRRDGIGRRHQAVITGSDGQNVFTPDDVMTGLELEGDVIVYDDDHYFMGGALAEKLKLAGHEVTIVTTESKVSVWTVNTLEQSFIQARLLNLGVNIVTDHYLAEITPRRRHSGLSIHRPTTNDTSR